MEAAELIIASVLCIGGLGYMLYSGSPDLLDAMVSNLMNINIIPVI